MLLAVTSTSEAGILDAHAPTSAASDVKAWEMGTEHEKIQGCVWGERISVTLR